METAYVVYTAYCPSCSALVVEPDADHCLICDLDFATNPPATVSPELEKAHEAFVEAQSQTETPEGLRFLAWLAQVVAVVFEVVLVIAGTMFLWNVCVAIWNAIF